jgi:hypothetical protein
MINEVLQKAHDGDETHDLWLAHSYDSIVDIANSLQSSGTRPPVDEQWRSPFIGKSIKNAAGFVKNENAPKPPKALNKTYSSFWTRNSTKRTVGLPVCRLIDGEV